jgi:hypothetical protein
VQLKATKKALFLPMIICLVACLVACGSGGNNADRNLTIGGRTRKAVKSYHRVLFGTLSESLSPSLRVEEIANAKIEPQVFGLIFASKCIVRLITACRKTARTLNTS